MVKQADSSSADDLRLLEHEKASRTFERKFRAYLVFAVVYGLVFVNYIDNISGGFSGYHLWLVFMYFFPFFATSIFFPKSWQLTIGLGLLASLMNDVFYGVVRNLMGFPFNLKWYYTAWLIPGKADLFQMNLGFAVVTVVSWMMAASIYARIIAVVFLLGKWRTQAGNFQ